MNSMHKAIATRIIELAEEHGGTVTGMARKGGIKQSTISEILNGRSKHPKISTIQAYCNGCGITLDEFFNSPLFRVKSEEEEESEE